MPFYLKYLSKSNIIIIGFHIWLGIALSNSPQLSTLFGWSIALIGVLLIIKYKNKYNDAANFAGYIVSLEIVMRITGASVFWEFGKYSIIMFLTIGMISENVRYMRINTLSVSYIAFLLPSIFFLVDIHGMGGKYIRNQISLNLSGPACLFICFLYFRNRLVSISQIKTILKLISLPIISLCSLILYRMPAISDLTFSSEANFQMSGGYGPNQVSTILGMSIIIIGASKFLNFSLFNKYIDNFFGFFCIGISLLTYARGGVLAPFIAIGIGSYVGFNKEFIKFSKIFYSLITVVFLFYLGSIFTEGSITERYLQLARIPFQDSSQMSGRTLIMALDYKIFLDHPFLGVGPGGATRMRPFYGYGSVVSAHSEFSRMLAEHGIFGLFSLLSIILLFYIEFRRRDKIDIILLIVFCTFSILTMFHSAFRLAAPGYFYGLAYIIILRKSQSL